MLQEILCAIDIVIDSGEHGTTVRNEIKEGVLQEILCVIDIVLIAVSMAQLLGMR